MKTAEATLPLRAPAAVFDLPAPDPRPDSELIRETLAGDQSSFEVIIRRYQPKIFGTVRRYARRESEVEDIVQEIFIKSFQKLTSFRGDAPFEHWLMRLAVRTCYDFLRQHQRNREFNVTDVSDEESNWLENAPSQARDTDGANAARELIEAILSQLPPAARMVITLLEIEERSVKEISRLTGWSETLVKVRAFRARAEMKKILARFPARKYL
jgi:RNA polymerase sigma-70 factor (ECF subfamily)